MRLVKGVKKVHPMGGCRRLEDLLVFQSPCFNRESGEVVVFKEPLWTI